MARQADVKQKLKLIGQSAVMQIITDILLLADRELILDVDEGKELTAEDYARISSKLITRQKSLYRSQITVDSIKVKQIDIETAIAEIKEYESRVKV